MGADADSVGVVVVVDGVVVIVGLCFLLADATIASHSRFRGYRVGVWGCCGWVPKVLA